MSQGYRLTLTIPGGTGDLVQFQNATVRSTSDELDTSSSLNADGSPNEGFSDADGDLGTVFVEIDTIIKDARVRAFMAAFEPGTRYPNVAWDVTYIDTGYAGVGLYCQDFNMTAAIPGAARMRMSFRSLQAGYTIAT